MMLVIESSERTKFSVLLIDNPTTVCETFNRLINCLRGRRGGSETVTDARLGLLSSRLRIRLN